MTYFIVDPNIAKAKTIHTDFYNSEEVFEDCKEKFFARLWQFIGSEDNVKNVGDVQPFTLLPGYLNEPLLLTRDKSQQINLLSNVCTHRGNLLADKACKATNLRCHYHGRLFGLDGKFISMPEFKEVEDFPSEADNLHQLTLFTWGKLLFTSLDPKYQPEIFFKDIMERVNWMPLNNFKFEPLLSQTFTVKAHWALYCENYLEGFHIPFVHAG